jgi:hypothetical protein
MVIDYRLPACGTKGWDSDILSTIIYDRSKHVVWWRKCASKSPISYELPYAYGARTSLSWVKASTAIWKTFAFVTYEYGKAESGNRFNSYEMNIPVNFLHYNLYSWRKIIRNCRMMQWVLRIQGVGPLAAFLCKTTVLQSDERNSSSLSLSLLKLFASNSLIFCQSFLSPTVPPPGLKILADGSTVRSSTFFKSRNVKGKLFYKLGWVFLI